MKQAYSGLNSHVVTISSSESEQIVPEHPEMVQGDLFACSMGSSVFKFWFLWVGLVEDVKNRIRIRIVGIASTR